MSGLLDCAHQGSTGAHHHLIGSHDARTLALEEVTIDGDVAASDLTVGEHAARPDHELGSLAERDRALLEQALDLDHRTGVELERCVAQDVAATEVAAIAQP